MIIIAVMAIAISAILGNSEVEVNGMWWVSGWENTINVEWEGIVYAVPDIIMLNLSTVANEETTAQAQKEVNESINELKGVLIKNWVEEKNIQTTNVYIRPDYEYNRIKEESELVWYEAGQSISVKIVWVDEDNAVASKIIDQVSSIDGIELHWINYDIDDKTPYYSQARKLAVEKAEQKAYELADYSGESIDWVESISEYIKNNFSPYYATNNSYKAEMVNYDMASDWWSVSIWQMEISVNVSIVYEMK